MLNDIGELDAPRLRMVRGVGQHGPRLDVARPVIDDIDVLDVDLFGINPKEAEIMDPWHRLFLECAWDSIRLLIADHGLTPLAV
ncbi:MAG TPA: beta-ketoacyl synthase N-terminal-like domain-containing protein [Herpetosiphonaceae bacterium]